LPAEGKEEDVNEQERGHDVVRCRSAEVGHAAQYHHASAHSRSANHGQDATAEVAINADNRDDGCCEEPGAAATRKEECSPVGVSELLSEHAAKELDKKVDAGELLEELQHDLRMLVMKPRVIERRTKLTRKNETV
jgi:hypothetical protein